MLELLSRAHWFKVRDEAIDQARKCREVLTNSENAWRYTANDPRVKKAVKVWLDRAKRAQAIAMGRQPVIEKLVTVNNDQVREGEVYAG